MISFDYLTLEEIKIENRLNQCLLWKILNGE